MSDLKGQLGSHLGGREHQLLADDLTLLPNTMPAPTEAELENTYVAPGRLAQLRYSIAYHAHWKNVADGMSMHARHQVKALATTGLPLRLQSLGQRVILNEELDPEVKDLLYLEGVSSTHTAISIKQIVFDTPAVLREAICPAGIRSSVSAEAVDRIAKSTVIYTSWERSSVHPQFVELLKGVGQLWVPCETNKRVFVSNGVPEHRVKVVPCPYDPMQHTIAAPRGVEDVPVGRRFYHIGKWEPRKNQHRLLGAFFYAFTPKNNASLFIKTSGFGLGWGTYPSFKDSMELWLADEKVRENGWTSQAVDRLVRVVDKRIPAEDLNRIHKENNIYVSSGLGEAWDMPAFSAKMAGNRLVYVGYGGPEDYAESSDIQIYREGLEPVHPNYNWEPEAAWASVSLQDLAAALKQAYPMSERLVPAQFCRKYGYAGVGRLMSDCLQELAEELGCWDKLVAAGGFG